MLEKHRVVVQFCRLLTERPGAAGPVLPFFRWPRQGFSDWFAIIWLIFGPNGFHKMLANCVALAACREGGRLTVTQGGGVEVMEDWFLLGQLFQRAWCSLWLAEFNSLAVFPCFSIVKVKLPTAPQAR